MKLNEVPLPVPDFTGIDTKDALYTLKRAAHLIDIGKERYLCLALAEVGKHSALPYVADDMQDRIEAALEPNIALGGWLERKVPLQYVDDEGDTMSILRLEWCDRMIKQLEALGGSHETQ